MYEHLLVPVDGSELSDRAMTASIELARKLGARITGFMAEPYATPPPGIGLGYGAAVTQHDQAAQDHRHSKASGPASGLGEHWSGQAYFCQ